MRTRCVKSQKSLTELTGLLVRRSHEIWELEDRQLCAILCNYWIAWSEKLSVFTMYLLIFAPVNCFWGFRSFFHDIFRSSLHNREVMGEAKWHNETELTYVLRIQNTIWSWDKYSHKTKLRTIKALRRSLLLYGLETWKVRVDPNKGLKWSVIVSWYRY